MPCKTQNSHLLQANHVMNSTLKLSAVNCTECAETDSPHSWTYFQTALPAGLAAIHIFILLSTVVGNALVLITLKKMKKRQMQHYVMIGLCFADLSTLISQLPSTAVLLNGGISLNRTICNMWGIVSMSTLEITVWLHCVLCIEKCLSVRFPLAHRRFINTKLCRPLLVTVLISCIVLPLLISSALLLTEGFSIYFEPTFPLCFISSDRTPTASAVIAALFGFIPFSIQLITNAMIVHTIRTLRNIARFRVIYAVKTLALTLGLYYVCWVPILIAILWRWLTVRDPPDVYTLIAYQVLMLNSSMSFCIYTFTLPGFKLALLPKKNQNLGLKQQAKPTETVAL